MPARDYIERLARQRFQGRMRNAFLAAIDRITSEMEFERIVRLIEAGDTEGALQAVGLNADNFPEIEAATAAALAAGGRETAAIVPPKSRAGVRVAFSFQPGNRRAEQAVDELHTSAMRGLDGGPAITREGARAVQEHIRRGLQEGKNPREIARRMRGTWDKQARAYRGGIIGLTDTQAQHVANAEAQLRSGDPKQYRRYLGRKLRDRRFDRSVVKAIREGTEIPERTINNAVSGYSRKYINFRAETVARDQTLSALSRGQQESLDQAIADGHMRQEDILQDWIHAQDDRVRNAHRRIPAMNPGGVRRGESFQTPLGRLRYPRDPQGTAANTIMCRCTLNIRVRRAGNEVPSRQVAPAGQRTAQTRPPQQEQRGVDQERRQFASDEEVAQEVRGLGRRDGNEHLIATDSQGRELFRTSSGANSAVTISDEQRSLIGRNGSVITHHNHPNDASLSLQDLRSQGATPGEIEVQAHGMGGSSFGGSVVDNARFPFRTPDVEVQRPVADTFRSAARKGIINQDEATEVFNHVQNLAMRRAGIIDYRPTLTARQRQIEQRIFGDADFNSSFEGLVDRFNQGFE